MELVRVSKSAIRGLFHGLGWELSRLSEPPPVPPIRPLLQDPIDALLMRLAGKQVAFQCPINLCRAETGFGMGPDCWHPFVATLCQYQQNPSLEYDRSVLKRYYDLWQPGNAAEAIVGLIDPPEHLQKLPPYCVFKSPWKYHTQESLATAIDHWSRRDNLEHGRPDLEWHKDGFKHFGPVSPGLGQFEFARLTNTYDQLKAHGYDRSHDDIGVIMIRHGTDYRFLAAGGGLHRLVAMAALGYKTVPAQYKVPHYFADTRDVDHWPQVQLGLWTVGETRAYIDHLFSCGSRAWARNLELL